MRPDLRRNVTLLTIDKKNLKEDFQSRLASRNLGPTITHGYDPVGFSKSVIFLGHLALGW